MSVIALTENQTGGAVVAGSSTCHWLHVVSHTEPRYGGLSAAVPALVAKLDGSGHVRSTLAAFTQLEERFRPECLTQDSVSFWPTGHATWLRDAALRSRFSDLLEEADGVHIHGLWEASTAMAARVARTTGRPYIVSAHGMLEPWALQAKRLKKALYSALVERANIASATALHALTHDEAQQYISFGAQSPIVVIPNAVEVPRTADSVSFLREYPELRGKRNFLYLGRLHPKKGLDMLLEAWSSASASHPEAQLVLAGPDCEGTRAGLEAIVKDHALSSVTFTGMLGQAMKWSALAACGAFVLPSHSEGLSVGVLEAMGMGLPVLITRPCNMPEVAAANAGLSVEPTTEALASALQILLSRSEAENQIMGRCGARLVASRYSWPVVLEQFLELYRWASSGAQRHNFPERLTVVLP